jgi:hypothetical protein
VGERLLPVIGEPLPPGAWQKLRHEASGRRWQWMVRRDGVWTHVLNLARFVNSGCGSDMGNCHGRCNARYVMQHDDGDENSTLYLESSTAIRAGEEVVACGRHTLDDDVWPWSCYVQMRAEALIP